MAPHKCMNQAWHTRHGCKAPLRGQSTRGSGTTLAGRIQEGGCVTRARGRENATRGNERKGAKTGITMGTTVDTAQWQDHLLNKQASTIGYLKMLRQNKPNNSTSKRDYWRVIICSELKDNIKREACAPRPSHYANQRSDYASNFIALSASLKRLPVARLSWKTRAESPAGTTSINQAGLKWALQQ